MSPKIRAPARSSTRRDGSSHLGQHWRGRAGYTWTRGEESDFSANITTTRTDFWRSVQLLKSAKILTSNDLSFRLGGINHPDSPPTQFREALGSRIKNRLPLKPS